MPIGTLTKRTDLQPNAAVRTPPEMDPAANPAESAATNMPRARFLSLPSGNVVTRIAKAVAGGMAAPTPLIALDSIWDRMGGAKPPVKEATAKRTIPKTERFFLP